MVTGSDLVVRRIRLDYPEGFDPLWNERFPEFAAAANGISMLMPYAEPYFVHTARKALGDLDDDALRDRTLDFMRQEGQHHRQHRRFNDHLLERYPRLERLERRIERTYGWFDRTRSLRFNVAFSAGSECIAYALARWTEKHLARLFDDADPVASTLYFWHLAEEVEHKEAAFDVFEAVDGSRLRYAWATTISVVLLAWFVWRAALVQLAGEGRAWYPVTWFRLTRWSVSLAFTMLPTLAVSALPGHHPRRFADPVYLPAWLRQYDPDTGTIPVWRADAA